MVAKGQSARVQDLEPPLTIYELLGKLLNCIYALILPSVKWNCYLSRLLYELNVIYKLSPQGGVKEVLSWSR